MDTVKKLGMGLLGTFIMVGLLMVVLRWGKKLPGVGKVASHAENIVTQGTL